MLWRVAKNESVMVRDHVWEGSEALRTTISGAYISLVRKQDHWKRRPD
jgi:hypothetical protein